MGYGFLIVSRRRDKWLFGLFTSIMGKRTVFAMLFKGLRRCVQTATLVTQSKASLPFSKTNSVPPNQLRHLKEFQDDSGLTLFQSEVRHQLWDQANQYRMLKPEYMVRPSQPRLSKMDQIWANVVGNSCQKALACLRDANAYSQTVVTNALAVVIASVQVNGEFAFAVHDTCEIRQLCWG